MTDVQAKVRGFSVRMFLADGQPEGLRLVEKSNWNGVGVMCSRAQYPAVRMRAEFERAGVYVLLGVEESAAGRPRVYIGEGDFVRARFDKHVREKDFWTHLVLFTSRDQALHKAHVQHLESRLVALAYKAKRAAVENENKPQLPTLSEADVADADAFLDDVLLILPLLGVTAFDIVETKVRSGPTLWIKAKGVQAEGRDGVEGFVVFGGSQAVAATVTSIHPYLAERREELVRQHVLEASDGILRFTQDFVFESPSMAAGVVLGRSANGRIEWKNQEGRPLKELQEQAIKGNAT
jgi:hypothetical protein